MGPEGCAELFFGLFPQLMIVINASTMVIIRFMQIPICRTQIYENIDLVANKYVVKRKGILGQHGRFCEIPMYLAEFNGAYRADVERQSISNRHKYLQAIADLEIAKFI